MKNDYQFIDSGDGRKLERFGDIILNRPCSQAVWRKNNDLWNLTTAKFNRNPSPLWTKNSDFPDEWIININNQKMKLSITDFGHIGIFPETIPVWEWIQNKINNEKRKNKIKFLNLFAYSGGATIAAAKCGAECCHLDSSKGMVDWARTNADINNLNNAPIRWIVDDVIKFLKREVKRGNKYDAILLDPPSFGHGKKGEIYKIEDQILNTLDLVNNVLSDDPLFVILTSHTPGFTPVVLNNLLKQFFSAGRNTSSEMVLKNESSKYLLPSGCWATWLNKDESK